MVTFWYYVRYAALYTLEAFFALFLPTQMHGTAMVILASHVGPGITYGGAALVAALFGGAAYVTFTHRKATRLIWYAGHAAIIYSGMLALDSLSHGLGSVLVWTLLFVNHITQAYAPSDVAILAEKLKKTV